MREGGERGRGRQRKGGGEVRAKRAVQREKEKGRAGQDRTKETRNTWKKERTEKTAHTEQEGKERKRGRTEGTGKDRKRAKTDKRRGEAETGREQAMAEGGRGKKGQEEK